MFMAGAASWGGVLLPAGVAVRGECLVSASASAAGVTRGVRTPGVGAARSDLYRLLAHHCHRYNHKLVTHRSHQQQDNDQAKKRKRSGLQNDSQ